MNLSLRLVIILVLSQQVFARITTKDSLFSALPQKEGRDKIIIYTHLAHFYQMSNPDSSLRWAQTGLILAQQTKDMWGMAACLNRIGLAWYNKGYYLKADAAYLKSFKISSILEDSELIANNLNLLGQAHVSLGNYTKALEYYLQSLKVRERLKNDRDIAATLSNIGTIYTYQEHYTKASYYHTQALTLLRKIPDAELLRATVTQNLAYVYQKQGKYTQALAMYQKIYSTFIHYSDHLALHTCLMNIAATYRDKGEYPQALTRYMQALNIANERQVKDAIALNLIGISETYTKMNQTKESIPFANNALKMARESQAKQVIKQACMVLYQNHKTLQDYNKALHYFEQAQQVEDSMLTVENAKAISTMEAKYKLERQQTEMESLQQSTQVTLSNYSRQGYLFMGIIISVVIIIFLLLRHYQQEKKIEQLLVKQKISELAYLNAHKIRGPVASILGLVSLFNSNDLSDSFNRSIIEYIHTAAKDLDTMIHEVANKTQFMYQMHELGAGELVYHKHQDVKRY